MIDRTLAVAPMLDWSDRYFRFFMRLISPSALLYSEMVTTGALLHGDRQRLLGLDPSEHPLALQLGGSNPSDLARCCRIGEQWGYDEINLNVGCPSDRVQEGRFGACLMAEPRLVSDCVVAMKNTVSVPVTVKHRTGIDDRDSYQELCDFVGTVAEAGCSTFIVHARKAWLKGLSPKENREIPPLEYEKVHQLKRDFPDLQIVINGGITSLDDCRNQLDRVDGVMIGREAYRNPWLLAEIDRELFGDPAPPANRIQVIEQLLPFTDNLVRNGLPLNKITRHILGLFHGEPGARAWRRHLSSNATKKQADISVIQEAARQLPGGRVLMNDNPTPSM
ncbi:MAG: tRNA dihydrouridine(20/20a) synthase DusA [Gammaproteobacteria bacterium]|nr:tRNA dihydrouridine(20/20a) synthase DusA [Gammaproteobacteria bacterium]